MEQGPKEAHSHRAREVQEVDFQTLLVDAGDQ